jgi:hypothetical protein
MHEQTSNSVEADLRNFKVENRTKDELHIERMLYAGNALDVARSTLKTYARKRPRGRLTIRQGIRVIAKWPRDRGEIEAWPDRAEIRLSAPRHRVGGADAGNAAASCRASETTRQRAAAEALLRGAAQAIKYRP